AIDLPSALGPGTEAEVVVQCQRELVGVVVVPLRAPLGVAEPQAGALPEVDPSGRGDRAGCLARRVLRGACTLGSGRMHVSRFVQVRRVPDPQNSLHGPTGSQPTTRSLP